MSDKTGIQIDFSKTIGTIKAIHGANMGPLCLDGGIDLSEWFRQIEFPTIRLHDCPYNYRECVDIPCIFPLFHLDESSPCNYKFARTDAYLQSILDCGSQVVYRLGVSIQGHPKYKFDTEPPADYEKWARICINTIKHYNEGWADGFHHNIRYWEIWNEPDDGHGQWEGTFEEFIDFYVTVAPIIKAACPDIKLGGPAFNGAMQDVDNHRKDFVDPFLKRVKETNSPLDFFSWHSYPAYPSHVTDPALKIRKLLDHFGFKDTESHLNEWNFAPYKNAWCINNRLPGRRKFFVERQKGAESGALAASCLTVMQDAPIDMANFYTASAGFYGMFHYYTYPAKPFFAFKAFKAIIDNTPNRLAVAGSDPDEALAVLAGTSNDKKTHNILISNFQNAAVDPWRITFGNLPKTPARLTFRLLDEVRDLQPADEQTFDDATVTLKYRIPPHAVYLLTIQTE